MKRNGWITAWPLKGHASLNELSLLRFIGVPWPKFRAYVQFDFNLYCSNELDPRTTLFFRARKLDAAKAKDSVFSFEPINRWSIDIKGYENFDAFLKAMKRWHRCTYTKSKEMFEKYGGTVTFISGDWSENVDQVYRLYQNVAERNGNQLYDLEFFKRAAKDPDYKLLCGWIDGQMIGVFILVEELPTLHSILCGFNYDYSTKSYAYSWMHYELFRIAMGIKQYETIDVGLSADKAKEHIGFHPTPFRMDLSAHTPISRFVLKTLSLFMVPKVWTDGLMLSFKLSFK